MTFEGLIVSLIGIWSGVFLYYWFSPEQKQKRAVNKFKRELERYMKTEKIKGIISPHYNVWFECNKCGEKIRAKDIPRHVCK